MNKKRNISLSILCIILLFLLSGCLENSNDSNDTTDSPSIPPPSVHPPDCNGDNGGTAFIDRCGECVEGNTGLVACTIDCNGVEGGTAYIDNCGNCVAGDTGNLPCDVDCHGDISGDAYLDPCGVCVEGNTGKLDGVQPCHEFTGLPLTPESWTDLEELVRPYSRIVYVSSSSGNDGTGTTYVHASLEVGADPFVPDGPIQPYATLAAAYNQLRDGYPDVMLLKKGDSWNEWFSSTGIGSWGKSGQSITERIMLGSYGNGTGQPRPIIKVDADESGFGAGSTDFLIVTDIHFYSYQWASLATGRSIDILGTGTHQLYEGCLLDRNINRTQGWGGDLAEIGFRRNIFIEGSVGELTASLYAQHIDGLLIEENIFYHPVEKNRHLYLASYGGIAGASSTLNVNILGNIFYTSTRTGLSIRSGGTIKNNLIIRNDLVLCGGHGGSDDEIRSGIIQDNVFLEATPDGEGDGEWGLWIKNNDGTDVSNNIWTDSTHMSGSTHSLFLGRGDLVRIAKNIAIHDNISYGRNGTGQSTSLHIAELYEAENVSIYNNDWQMVSGSYNIVQHFFPFTAFTYNNNRYFSTDIASNWFRDDIGRMDHTAWVAVSGETGSTTTEIVYTEPDRTLSTYQATLGGTETSEAFMNEVLSQSRDNWRIQYRACTVNDYIRIGFDKAALGCN